MSTWNLGANDVSEETRNYRDKLASKDGQVAAQADQLLKQAADLEELEGRLNDSLHKLTFETRRALQLEDDLRHRSDDLRNERIASENIKAALSSTLEKNKGRNKEVLELETTLERVSSISNEHQTRNIKLEKEKSTLEARVKELEANTHAVFHPTTPRRIHKPRSSSLSNIRITNLEQDLNDLRSQLMKKDAEVDQLLHKLSQAQQNRDRADNEKVATERRWHTEVKALQEVLDEKEEELRFVQREGDASREEELLRRIEEDGAKIEMLESVLRRGEDAKKVEEKVQKLGVQLTDERQQRLQLDKRLADLAREKEAALHEAQKEVARLAMELQERNIRDNDLDERARKSLSGCVDQLPHLQADAVGHIEKLLATVDRLREERDALRRDFHFLESESKFTIEALERQLVSSVSSVSVYETDDSIKTLGQLKNEMDELHDFLAETTAEYAAKLAANNKETRRLGLCLQGLAIALDQLENQVPAVEICESPALEETQAALNLVNETYAATVLALEKMTSNRDDLLIQLQNNTTACEKEARVVQHENTELQKDISELNAHIDHVESERDSLALQVTNLTTDIQNAQDELADAETRYTTLQFHQLSNMTSNEATRTLRAHIGELEARVMRRTEQIGIHQHDIRRLETNIRLQEDRLSEMTMELEMMAAQKNAMVEDCADAREARNEALTRVEALEEELESSSENERLVIDLIAVVVDTAARTKQAMRHARDKTTATEQRLDAERRVLQQRFDDQEVSLKTLTQLSGQYREELEKAKSELTKGQLLITDVSEREEEARQKIVGLEAQIACAREGDKISELKLQHAEMVASLQQRLVQSESALEVVETRYKSAEVDHQIALEDATSSIRELEEELEHTKMNLEEIQDRLRTLEKDHMKEIDDLQAELKAFSEDYQQAIHERDTIAKEDVRLRNELERLQQRQEDIVADLRAKHRDAQHEFDQKMTALQGRLDETSRLCDTFKVENMRLSDNLNDMKEGRVMDQKNHDNALQSATEEMRHAEEHLRLSEDQISESQKRLEHAETQVEAAEAEKTALQQNITVLEADIQKEKSINRYHDLQNKESERLIINLKAEVDRLKGEVAHSEKACKAAEVNLSLKNAHHKRETTELRQELSSLRLRPNLEVALRELEERNNAMEELLRAKCTEIEANDDRVIELLKEKKKITTKVETLNRKVQNLQAKLAAAKASCDTQQSGTEHQVTQITSNTKEMPIPAGVSVSRPRAATVVATSTISALPTTTPPMHVGRNPPQRILSGPSSLPRPKTPERNRHHVPVFKARTPEQAALDAMATNVVIGKKRAVPDDFEACENIPAQAFSADGKDAENRTPRVRRVLGNLHSTFTPNRNQNRPTAPAPSPKRAEPTPSTLHMSDMTNSPVTLPPAPTSSSRPTKRSWLGKIRGTSRTGDKP